MFGVPSRVRRPTLLILVLGAFLVLIGITASAQAAMVSAHFSASALNDLIGSDSATVRGFVNAYVQPRYLDAATGGPTAVELERLQAQLTTLTARGEILRVELRLPDGTILAANDTSLAGRPMPVAGAFALAVAGAPQAALVPQDAAEAGPGQPFAAPTLLREYLPVIADQKVRAVVGIWRDAGPVLDRLAAVRRDVVLVTLTAGIIAAMLLLLIFRSAQGRLTRQTAALIESARRDALTGALSHGALVGHLAVELERARASGLTLGVALIDIDNFRLLNDNHGHPAGDTALVSVMDLLRRHVPDGIVAGRYGPDEFLLVASSDTVAELEPVVERVRAALVDLSLQFETTTEKLPVTISAGLCTYPEHGASVTALLSAAARTLQEARNSGGDAIRIAGIEAEEAAATGFDVLQGLVIAIDTKDRYTKRHSDDVARYAVFLAERLGLDPEFIRSIQLAGLLHDIGKIGIPDPILRKPGRLTAAEYNIVKQHVALGDMIVRDVPDVELVRAGIRHLHERWDGDGYLHRLEGEAIPLIARILAVGDAFSAMTTTRPYRKALDVKEALTRLEDASGSQLDAQLVRLFVDGIQSVPNAPLPGVDVATPTLWTPRQEVA